MNSLSLSGVVSVFLTIGGVLTLLGALTCTMTTYRRRHHKRLRGMWVVILVLALISAVLLSAGLPGVIRVILTGPTALTSTKE